VNTRHIPALLATLVIGFTTPAFSKKKVEYDFMGPTGILATREIKGGITVHGVEPGSPADGVLKEGDVILKIRGEWASRSTKDFHAQLTAAVLLAESEDGGGKLPLTLNGDREVALSLKVLGAFSPTAPYNCAKTDKIITGAADALAKEITGSKSKRAGTSATHVELLGLMATGEKKYLEIAHQLVLKDFGQITYDGKSLQVRNTSGRVGTWDTGYATIALAECYMLTKDPAILPALKTYVLSLVEGQDPAGLYGHKMANPETNRAPGYGQMNNVSLACYLGMILAKKAGADVPGLDEAIERSEAYVKYHHNAGGFAYGFHGPREWEWNNNGTSAMAAICMALSGEKEAASFFAASTAASADSLGVGHASSLFSTYWTPSGAHVLGPEVTQRFFPKTLTYFTVRRKWDGSFVQCYNEGHMAGVILLAHCLPRKALLITGREADESLWLNAKEAQATVEMGDISMDGKKPEEILAYFGHPFPQVRSKAVSAIHGMVSGKTYAKLEKENPQAALASKRAAAALFPKFKRMLATGTQYEKYNALRCYLIECPEDEMVARIADLGAILRDKNQSDELRARASTDLAMAGTICQPYFNDILKFLMEDRPNDRFAEIDAQIAEGIDKLGRQVEWDYYKAGLVTDRELFHQAANRLMAHKRQWPRGTGARLVRHVPQDRFHLVARPLEHILKDDDTTYHTYHNARYAMEPAVQVFADHDILEGVGYLTDYILGEGGKLGFKLRLLSNNLACYGAHAKPMLPRIKDYKYIKVMYKQAKANGSHPLLPDFEQMVSEIENATEGPPLVPLEEAIKLSKQADKQSTK